MADTSEKTALKDLMSAGWTRSLLQILVNAVVLISVGTWYLAKADSRMTQATENITRNANAIASFEDISHQMIVAMRQVEELSAQDASMGQMLSSHSRHISEDRVSIGRIQDDIVKIQSIQREDLNALRIELREMSKSWKDDLNQAKTEILAYLR